MITQSGNATISHKENDPNVTRLITSLRKAEVRNGVLYEIPCPKYQVKIVYSNDEYDREFGTLGEKVTHRGGCVLPNKTFLIYFDSLKPLQLYEGEQFDAFIFHELNHVFYIELVGGHCPVWLHEGIATHHMKTWNFDKQGWKKHFRTIPNPERFLHYQWIKKRYYENSGAFVTFSTLVYEHLYNTYGKKKILQLLHQYKKKKSKKGFEEVFQKIFKTTVKKAATQAIYR